MYLTFPTSKPAIIIKLSSYVGSHHFIITAKPEVLNGKAVSVSHRSINCHIAQPRIISSGLLQSSLIPQPHFLHHFP